MTKRKHNSADLSKIVVSLLSCGPKTCAEMAPILGLDVKQTGTVMTYMQFHGIAEKAGYVNLPKRHHIVLWKLRDKSRPVEPLPEVKRASPVYPHRVYRSLWSEALGEPPIGRSALDQRARQ